MARPSARAPLQLSRFGATTVALLAVASGTSAMMFSDQISCRISYQSRPSKKIQRRSVRVPLSASSTVPSSSSSTTSFAAVRTGPCLSRSEASKVMDSIILPQSDYGSRLVVGGDAQGLKETSGAVVAVVSAHDSRLAYTYGEFPLTSLDELLDRAETYGSNQAADDKELDNYLPRRRLRFVDVGSGCGRLCLYVALTRPNWDVSGIECAPLLHHQALEATERAIQAGYMHGLDLYEEQSESEPACPDSPASSVVRFRCAMADDASSVLSKGDVVFAYSTTWQSSGFSVETSSMLLSDDWQELFTSSCRPGCVVITTDRSLDSSTSSWRMLDQVNVGNPEVEGSTGYLQQRV